jgi:replicative superfamily II helicase
MIKDEVISEIEKEPRPVTEGILACLNHKIDIDKITYEEYQKILQEKYFDKGNIKKAIELTIEKQKEEDIKKFKEIIESPEFKWLDYGFKGDTFINKKQLLEKLEDTLK